MDILSQRPTATRRAWFWVLFALLAAGALALALPLFPRAFPILDLHISMNQQQALARAQELATRYRLGPDAASAAADFSNDDDLQNYVELEAGGVPAFRTLIASGVIAPYTWTVRRFNPDQVHEASITFTPAGVPWSFQETISEAQPGPALSMASARALAVAAATQAPWNIDLQHYRELSPARTERPNKRVDYTFTYERQELRIGEAPIRLILVVTGDHLSAIERTVEVPEGFNRRYASLRAANDLIANIDMLVVVIVVLAIGAIAIVMMSRRRILAWRPAVCCGLGIGLLLILAELNQLPLEWLHYDTSHSPAAFKANYVLAAASNGIAMGLIISLTFFIAEGLSRMAFPEHPRLWTVWRLANAGSNAVLGRVVAGYLLVLALLALQIVFYAVVNKQLGWWSPASALTDPNALACWQPWFTPCVQATQAGMWEESLFRAIPLAAAALLGKRLGYPRLILAIAVVLQAVMFGAAHANYPNQPAYARLVEIAIPFAAVGVIYIRYGLVVGMVMHACFDLSLMSLPLFVSDAPGIVMQRAMVILIGGIPLWVTLGARLRLRGRATTVSRNGDPEPPPAPAAAKLPAAEHPLSPRVIMAVVLLGSCAVATLIALGAPKREVPGLTQSPAQATRVARGILSAQGVDAGSWQAILTCGTDQPGDTDCIAYIHAHDQFPDFLAEGWLWGPCSTVRFVHWQGSLDSRAEEWSVTQDAQGRLVRIWHLIPEAAPGAQLEQPAAVALGQATLSSRFPQSAARMHLLSSTPLTRPHRRDWVLDYSMRSGDAFAGIDKNISITIAGDRVVDAYRYLFVPEALTRSYQRHGADLQILSSACSLVLALMAVALLVIAVIGAFRHRIPGSPYWQVGILCCLLELLHKALSMPETLAGYSTARPLMAQLSTTIVAGGVGALLMGGCMSLMVVGYGLRGSMRPGLMARYAGAMWAVILIALVVIIDRLLGHGRSPRWPALDDSDGVNPLLAVTVHGLLQGLVILVLVQGAVRALHLIGDHGRSRARGAWVHLLCLLLALAMTAMMGPASWAAGAASALALAIALGIGLRLVLSDERTVLPFATMLAVGLTLTDVLQPGFPGAALGGLIASAGIVVMAWWWERERASRPRALPA